MSKYAKYAIFILMILTLFLPSAASAKGPADVLFDDKVIFGGTFTLESGESLDGNLVIFGGTVTTADDTVVNGDVVLLGGVAEIGGTIRGSFVGIGGAVRLASTAVVNGDLVTIGATLNRDEGARVNGQIVNGMGIPFTFEIPDEPDIPDVPVPDIPDVPVIPAVPQTPSITANVNPLVSMLWFFFRILMWALIAVLVVIFFEKPASCIAKTAINEPLITGAAGLITAILTPFALVALTLTLILIPVTLITVLILVVAWMFGIIALGLEIGRRIAEALNMEWAPAISAGVGAFILILAVGGLNQLVACIGWIPQVLVGIWGLGAVIMTRFGTQDYPSDGSGEQPAVVVEADLPGVFVPEMAAETEVETVVAPVADEETLPEDEPGSEEPAADPESDE